MSNRFDQAAANWDAETRRVRMAQEVQTALCEAEPLDASMDLLDFGCGTGLFSLALAPRVRSLTGADPSAAMLEVFAQKAAATGTTVQTRRIIEPLELGGPYHLILSNMTLHHVHDLTPVFQAFHAALAPGGRIALADLDLEDGSFHGPAPDVHHLGFDRQTMMEILAQAGFEALSARTATTVAKGGRDYSIFLITGRKA